MRLWQLSQSFLPLDIRDTEQNLISSFFYLLRILIYTEMKKCEMTLISDHVTTMLYATFEHTSPTPLDTLVSTRDV